MFSHRKTIRNGRAASFNNCSIEPLEDRRLLASIAVTTTADTLSASDGKTSLREAIKLANSNSGPDTIVLAAGSTYSITGIDNSRYGSNGLPAITSTLTIEGNGATIQRATSSSTPAFRLFYVAGYGNEGGQTGLSEGHLTINNLTISNGLSKGEQGKEGGGGGGAGMGGAIYNNGSTQLNNVLLTGNKAQGGSGGIRSTKVGAGGQFAGTGGGAGTAAGSNGVGGYGGYGGGGGKGTTASGGWGGFGGGGGSTATSFADNRGHGGFGGGYGNVSNGAGGGGAGFGGAVFNDGGFLAIYNSTLFANTAVGGNGHERGQGLGGAIFSRGGNLTIQSITASSNNADVGRGLYTYGYLTALINNSIFGQADTSIPDIQAGSRVNGEGNFVGNIGNFDADDDDEFFVGLGDPKLGPLANNGGPTKTLALLASSRAIDSGYNSLLPPGLTTDQRGAGFARVKGDAVDVGAFESDLVPPSTFSVGDTSVQEGDGGTRQMVFTITRSGDVSGGATLQARTESGTATTSNGGSGTPDFLSVSSALSFGAGEATKTVKVSVYGDTSVEPDETIRMVLFNPHGGKIIDGEGIGTILNDDGGATPSIPQINFANANVYIDEGDSGTQQMYFNVNLEKASSVPVTVQYATGFFTGNQATAEDFVPTSGTLTFAPGQTSQQIAVTIIGDEIEEYTDFESFYIELSSPTNATLGSTFKSNGTIREDDEGEAPVPPDVTVSGDVSITEGNSGTKTVTLTYTLSKPWDKVIAFNYETRNVTAGEGDYTPVSGQLRFQPGETIKQVNITIKGDTKTELDETFTVNWTGGTIIGEGRNTDATVTILNDDGGTLPTYSINDVSMNEGNLGRDQIFFTVKLSKASSSTVRINYATSNGTAGEGDYNATSGTLTFAPGQTTQTIAVTLRGDTKVEANETFKVNLSNGVNVLQGDALGIGTILNDD